MIMSLDRSVGGPSLVLLVLACGGCGAKRAEGDAGGVPVSFRVTLERPFVSNMGRGGSAGVGVGVGTGVSSSGASSMGVGVGLGFSSTTVYLLGGDETGHAGLFRRKLSWGDNDFTIPITPGRQVALTVQVEGGRKGWEGIGAVTVPVNVAKPNVTITLNQTGALVLPAPSVAEAP